MKNDFCVLFFGGGKFNKNEKGLIGWLDLTENDVIHLSGSDELLAKLYSDATAFIYPSKYEGFGIPPLEAMSYGCPVVCSNTSSIPEVAGNAAEMFDPYNIDSIRETLENVIYNSEKMKILPCHSLGDGVILFRDREWFSWLRILKRR